MTLSYKLNILAKVSVCILSLFSIQSLATPSVTWQTYDDMKAEIYSLSTLPDNEYVYQQVRLIIDSLPQVLARTRTAKSYHPDFMWALSSWEITLETLSLYVESNTDEKPKNGPLNYPEYALKNCDAWHFAFGMSWGENAKHWDKDTKAFWRLVTNFCEGEIHYFP